MEGPCRPNSRRSAACICWSGTLTAEQMAEIAKTKQVIYDAFKTAVTAGVAKDRAGILVDEQRLR
jgi:hypothetical protein